MGDEIPRCRSLCLNIYYHRIHLQVKDIDVKFWIAFPLSTNSSERMAMALLKRFKEGKSRGERLSSDTIVEDYSCAQCRDGRRNG